MYERVEKVPGTALFAGAKSAGGKKDCRKSLSPSSNHSETLPLFSVNSEMRFPNFVGVANENAFFIALTVKRVVR